MPLKEHAKPASQPFDYGATKPDGQHENYPVLPDEDRAMGFVRPVRRTYVHVGRLVKAENVELLPADSHHRAEGYTHREAVSWNEDGSPKGWRLLKHDGTKPSGCGAATTMGPALAETYARDPTYYGSTFCAGCQTHLPVEEFVWDGTQERVGS